MTEWKAYCKGTPVSKVVYPTITLGKSIIYFNRAAAKIVGDDVTHVIIMMSPKEEKIGFWFFRNRISAPSEMRNSVYKITFNPQVLSMQVTCKSLIKRTRWLQDKIRESGTNRFPLIRDNNQESMNDFYIPQFPE